MKDVYLSINDFVQAASMEDLRVLHRDTAWWARSGKFVLMRPDGSTSFSSINQLLEVLAGVGIRCARVEWDGLTPREDHGRLIPEPAGDLPPH